ncbi:putative cyclase-domain-containing protein [Coniochaeta sp. 2T2.1]|nr:putative cyclase-domain-containing protein [Coniochaeta sp. 2T2.1]
MKIYPDFDSVPRVEGQPQGNAWALWGREDELGTLNLLTPEVILAASREVSLGKSIQLDLRLDHFEHGIAGRERFEQVIVDFKEKCKGHGDYDIVAHDDVIKMNTQSSSQWDGLRHVGHQETGIYYNGMKHREIDEHWVNNGGIVGRGILLDYTRWRAETGQEPSTVNARTAITVDELEQVAAYQNTEFHTGDILIIRSGFNVWHDSTPAKERNTALDNGEFIGIEASMESVKWLWNHHFAAVAGDTVSFEVSPVPLGKGEVALHEWLLTHWGSPIGELWDLEKLSIACADANKWSFLFTSAPLHVYGGVGSTCNAIAIL